MSSVCERKTKQVGTLALLVSKMLGCRTKGNQVHIGVQGPGQRPLPQAGVCAGAA